jgi:hypothetical protein
MSRREMMERFACGAGAVLLAPVLPGCPTATPPVDPSPPQQAKPAGLAAELGEVFGVSREVAGRVLGRALKNGGDHADIFIEHRSSDQLKLEEEKVNVAAASVSVGAGVRVVVGDQSGYAYTESLAADDLLRAADTAASSPGASPRARRSATPAWRAPRATRCSGSPPRCR